MLALLLCIAPLLPQAAEPASGSSVLLVAAETLQDPRFRQTVVLATRHGRSRSTIGVIINRRLGVSLDRVFPQAAQAAAHLLHYGGPVATGQIVFLVRGDAAPTGAIAVGERLYFSSHRGSLLRLLDAPTPPTQLRVFNGFASWAQHQLESEIARGDWHVLPLDEDALLSAPLEELWPTLWRRATQVMVRAPARLFGLACQLECRPEEGMGKALPGFDLRLAQCVPL